jgi:hypothetical protein
MLATDSAGRSLTGAGRPFNATGDGPMRRPPAAHEQESAAEVEREPIDEPLTRILEN